MSPRQQAIKNGDVHYHGKPCCHCAGTLRYIGGNCVPCAKAGSTVRSKERWDRDPEHRERHRQKHRERYATNTAYRERQKAKTFELSGVKYAEKLLKNRRRDALKRIAARNDRPDT